MGQREATHEARPGLRGVAAFEATKGVLVLAAGLGVLSLLHRDVQHAAEEIVRHLHLNPARHYPRVFLYAAARTTDSRLLWLAAGAFAYSVVRMVEAYGLWRGRRWAEWFAALSGGLYLPVETFELVRAATPVRAGILLVNLGIVLYVSLTLARRSAPGLLEPMASRAGAREKAP